MKPQTDELKKTEMLIACAEVMGYVPTANQLAGYTRILADVTPAELDAAIQAHMRHSQWFPKPAELLSRIPQRQGGHLPADAAWAIALTASDESETVVWTNEIQQAMEAARPILEARDVVGARMAFKAVYERLTQGGAPKYTLSLGHDLKKREDAVQRALDMGMLTEQQARPYLPAPPVSPVIAAITGQVSNVVAFPGAVQSTDRDAKARKALEEMRAMLAKAEERDRPAPKAVGPEEMAIAARRLEAARAAMAADPPQGIAMAPQAACSEA